MPALLAKSMHGQYTKQVQRLLAKPHRSCAEEGIGIGQHWLQYLQHKCVCIARLLMLPTLPPKLMPPVQRL